MVGDVAADPDPREVAMAAFDSWNPAAGFFHTATRDVRFLSQRAANQFARERTRESPPPPSVTRHRQAPVVALPRPATDAFAEVLTARRTWRRFGSGAVDIGELATVLALSLGVQRWVRVGGRDVPLKTSPSGGARHPLEGYLVIRRVTGVEPGIYHYASDRHLLERLGGPVPLARIRTWFPHGGYFAQAPVLVFLAAVFARQLWRYPYARAYRAALVEAGHVAQTWCLASTALNLAPFCLMGLADSAIEADLGLDAVATPVLYAAGLGRRPGRSDWAPLPRGTLASRANPRL
jgi:SagB-type dehydrogenase family enzyme